jgi:hypothetical protein
MKKLTPILTGILLCYGSLYSQTFTRITTGDIVNDIGHSEGCSWIDYDDDGDLDMFVPNRAYQNDFLYTNNGDGTFSKITSGSIVNDGAITVGCTWGDVEGDGDLDLFVSDHWGGNNLFYTNNGDGTFTKITSGDIVNDGGHSMGSSWVDYDNDGDLDLFVANAGNQKDFLYANDGSGTFTKITTSNIVKDTLETNSCSWADFDSDGDLDLFVTCYNANRYYTNNGDGSFTEITSGGIVDDYAASHGCSAGDFDNDGDLDLFIANSYNQDNLLYRNDGNNIFYWIITGDIVHDGGDSVSSSWGDYDNDGDLDLFVTNHTGQDNFFYRNDGNGVFTKITSVNIVTDGGESETCVWGDYDNDGDLDLYVANGGGSQDEKNFLYQNDGNSNHWIKIRCIGTVSNTTALGTVVRVKAVINGSPVWQMRQISGQTGYASQNPLNAHFGLGDATSVDSIRIEWPSGIEEVYTNVLADKYMICTENQGATRVDFSRNTIPGKFELFQNYPNPFNPVTTIRFNIPEADHVTLKIFDIHGRAVKTILDSPLNPGEHRVHLDAGHLSSGVYFYRLRAGDFVQTKKLILLR